MGEKSMVNVLRNMLQEVKEEHQPGLLSKEHEQSKIKKLFDVQQNEQNEE